MAAHTATAQVAVSRATDRRVHPSDGLTHNTGMASGPKAAIEDKQDPNNRNAAPPAVDSRNQDQVTCLRNGVVDPRSRYYRTWEYIIMLLLLFTATVTPFEVGFLETEVNALFVVNRLVDVLFLKFNLGYLVNKNSRHLGCDRKKIAKEYLTGWFAIDIISILPFDIIGLIISSTAVSKLKILRLLRLLRLFKLMKLLKADEFFGKVQSQLGFKYSVMSLAKYMMVIFFVAHWIACLWHVVVKLEDDETITWVQVYFCNGTHSDCNPDTVSLYCACLYHATMTLTTIGYGDLVANTTFERWVSIFIQLLGASLYAYIVGVASGIVASMNKEKMHFQETMDELNQFMEDQSLSDELSIRLREYFQHLRAVDKMRLYSSLLERMSPGLRGEVAMLAYGGMIQAVPYLTNTGESFITQIALNLDSMVLSPGDLVVSEGSKASHLYFIADGVVSHNRRLETIGHYFGEEVIMETGVHRHFVRAVTYLQLYTLSRVSLLDVLQSFPRVQRLIRRDVMRMAFKRDVRKTLQKLFVHGEDAASETQSRSNLEEVHRLEKALVAKDAQLMTLLEEATALQAELMERLPRCQVVSNVLVNNPDERCMLRKIEQLQDELATSSQDMLRSAQYQFWKSRRKFSHSHMVMLGAHSIAPRVATGREAGAVTPGGSGVEEVGEGTSVDGEVSEGMEVSQNPLVDTSGEVASEELAMKQDE